ncbi:MAG: diacylglycerol kinase family protein [Muribaculaceae bacterium]
MDKKDWRLSKRIRSFGYAFSGIGRLFSQPNACIHAAVTVLVIAAGVWLRISATEWCLVSICIGGVLMAEAFNTAVEALADKVSPGYDPLIGRAKDLAAGAVLIFVLAAVAVGLIIFIPKIAASV